ncbi:MAG: hypothetical protein AAGA58_00810 [Verrucomicrobiota bacterium]
MNDIPPLATVGILIEVTPSDDLQHWANIDEEWSLIEDLTPFRFRVAGELVNEGTFFGLYGPVEAGPDWYLNCICNIMLRYDDSDWHSTTKCGAGFKVAPSIAKRVARHVAQEHSDVPFYLHPEGTSVEGYPRTSRYGGIQVVSETTDATL